MKSYPVTIIVPIYNVEKYIERCAVSLFEQDFDDIEYIFVNDCTPDNSMQILKSVLERYPHRQVHCKFIEHASNKGSGASRKTGLLEATGEYIIQIDADDWVELDMISSMYKEAKSKDLDILICDYYLEFGNITKHVKVKSEFCQDNIEAFKKTLSDELTGSLANKMVKRDLYVENNVFPLENISLAEDKDLSIRILFLAKKIGYLNIAFYHYIKNNNNSITNSISLKNLDDLKVFLKNIEDFLKDNNAYDKYKKHFVVLLVDYYKEFYDFNDNFLYENYSDLMSTYAVFNSTSSIKRKFKYLFHHFKVKSKFK